MTRREKLIDNYEDALFAVLMDKVAEEEGAKLREENQRLQNDPAAEVPEHVDAVARQTIRKAFAGQNRRSAFHVARRVLNTVAMLVLICSAVFATAYAAFPDVRVKTLNLLIQSSDVASKLSLVREDEIDEQESGNSENIVLCGYSLPEIKAFSVVDRNEDSHGGWIKYKNDDRDATIRISITNAKTEYFDAESAEEIKEISINNYSGILIEKESRTTIAWAEDDHGKYIMIVCANLSSAYVISIAEKVTYIGLD